MTRIASPLHDLRDLPPLPVDAAAAAAGAGLELEIRRNGRVPLVVVAGELDLAGRDLLGALIGHVRADHGASVEVDLGQVPFADTHGLEPLLEPGVVVVAASPAVRRLLRYLDVPLTPRPGPARPVAGRAPGCGILPVAGSGGAPDAARPRPAAGPPVRTPLP